MRNFQFCDFIIPLLMARKNVSVQEISLDCCIRCSQIEEMNKYTPSTLSLSLTHPDSADEYI